MKYFFKKTKKLATSNLKISYGCPRLKAEFFCSAFCRIPAKKKKKKNPGKNYCISLQEFKVSLEQNEGNNKLLDQYKGLRRTRQDFLLSSK